MVRDFWDNYIVGDGCWEWQLSTQNGYGRTSIKGKRKMAHVRAYEEFYNTKVPEGSIVIHTCDNRKCGKPSHLVLGTYKDNAVDCVSKGRHSSQTHPERIPRGENHWNAKLSNEAVTKIFQLRSEGHSQHRVASIVGCSQSHVSRVLLGIVRAESDDVKCMRN